MKNTKSSFWMRRIFVFLILVLGFSFLTPVYTNADTLWEKQIGMGTESDEVGNAYGETVDRNQVSDIRVVISKLIRIVLGFLGIIFLILIIYGGFMWMTANGDSSKVETAKSTIIRGVIGLIIILASFAIALFVTNRLLMATVSNGTAQ